MWLIIIANIFGSLSGIVFWASNFCKTKCSRSKVHLICNISDILQYICTASASGVVSGIIAMSKNITFLCFEDEKVRNKVLCGVSAIKVILLFFVSENLFGFLLIPLEILKLWILCKGTVKHVIWVSMLDSVLWMIYDFNAKAYVAAAMGVGSLLSAILGLIVNRGKLDSKK